MTVSRSSSSPYEAIGFVSSQDKKFPYESTGGQRVRRVGSTRQFQTLTEALVDLAFETQGSAFTEERIILLDAENYSDSVLIPPPTGIVVFGLQPTEAFPLIISGSEERGGGTPVIDAGGASIGIRITVDNVQISRIKVENSTTSFSVESDNVSLDGVSGSSSVGVSATGVSDLDIINSVFNPERIGIDFSNVTSFLLAHNSIRIASTESTAVASGISVVASTGGIEHNVIRVRKVRGTPTSCISLSDSPYVIVDRNIYSADQGGIVGRFEPAFGAGFTEASDISSWKSLTSLDGSSLEFNPLWSNDPEEGFITSVSVSSGEIVLSDTSKSFAVDELREKVIEFTDGPLSGQEFLVRVNTETTITLQDGDPLDLPAAGNEYRIQTGRGNAAVSLRPRARSQVAAAFAPIGEAAVDNEGNIRAGDLVSAGAHEMKDVRLSSRRKVLLEILAGLSGDHLSTVFAGSGGSLDRFTPKNKPSTETALSSQIISAPISAASVSGNRLTFNLEMGIDQTFRDKLLDGTIGFQDELGIGTKDGEIAIIRSGQRIVLDPLQQITHEVKVALEVVRS